MFNAYGLAHHRNCCQKSSRRRYPAIAESIPSPTTAEDSWDGYDQWQFHGVMHDYDSTDCDSTGCDSTDCESTDCDSTDFDLSDCGSIDCDSNDCGSIDYGLRIQLAKRKMMVFDHGPTNLRFDCETKIDKAGQRTMVVGCVTRLLRFEKTVKAVDCATRTLRFERTWKGVDCESMIHFS